jgi:hypothetical protein
VLSGDLSGFTNDYDPTTGGCTGRPAEGSDIVCKIDAESGSGIHVSYAQPGGDASVYLVTDYHDPGTCVAGSDVAGPGNPENLDFVVPSTRSGRSVYYLVLDGRGPGGGEYNAAWAITSSSAGVEHPGAEAAPVIRVPNPYRLRATIDLRLSAGTGRTDVALYEIEGRYVNSLLREAPGSDTRQLRWNGSTADGRRAPSGIYYLRTRNEPTGASASARLLLIR